MILQIYTYQFRPITETQESLFKEEEPVVDVMDNFAHKQEILEEILSNNKLKFRNEEKEFDSWKLFSRDGLTAYLIANEKSKTIEEHFMKRKEKHYPSCLVIFDNRTDIQHIAIERNGAFKSDQICEIIQYTLRDMLRIDYLEIDVRATYRKEEFWGVCNKFRNYGGIEYVRLTFPYPNLPKISDKVGEYFTDIARNTNSEPTLTLNGQGNEGLRVNENNKWLRGAIEACAESGTPIRIKPRKGNLRTVGMKSNVTEELKDLKVKGLIEIDLFDSQYQKIVEFMNIIKFTSDDKEY